MNSSDQLHSQYIPAYADTRIPMDGFFIGYHSPHLTTCTNLNTTQSDINPTLHVSRQSTEHELFFFYLLYHRHQKEYRIAAEHTPLYSQATMSSQLRAASFPQNHIQLQVSITHLLREAVQAMGIHRPGSPHSANPIRILDTTLQQQQRNIEAKHYG